MAIISAHFHLKPFISTVNCRSLKNIWVYVDPQKDYSKTLPERDFLGGMLYVSEDKFVASV